LVNLLLCWVMTKECGSEHPPIINAWGRLSLMFPGWKGIMSLRRFWMQGTVERNKYMV
jgi:hypothetical protein